MITHTPVTVVAIRLETAHEGAFTVSSTGYRFNFEHPQTFCPQCGNTVIGLGVARQEANGSKTRVCSARCAEGC